MIIGIPKEVKTGERRVACTPAGVRHLVAGGHRVLVGKGAGEGSGFGDDAYAASGATVLDSPAEVWKAELVVKVKEPVADEYPLLRENMLLFTFLHLAAVPELAEVLVQRGVSAIAYETVSRGGSLPLLAPMSEIAGRMSVMAGSFYLAAHFGGSGRLLPGAPGVLPGNVVVLGGGSAGMQAAKVAGALGARVTVVERDRERMRFLDTVLGANVRTLFSNEQHIAEELAVADLLVGAVLVPGASAPKLVGREMLRSMRSGSVFVDISIDQGGCSETSRLTTHADPVYREEGVLHYCVTNMPGAFASTSTEALAGSTLAYVRAIADSGFEGAMRNMPGLAEGLNTWQGRVTHRAVAESLGMEYLENPFLGEGRDPAS